MGELQKLLGASVRRLRTARGLTQVQLAEAIERSTDLVSRIERGDSAPSFDTLEKLSDALKASPAELFGAPGANDVERSAALGELLNLTAAMSQQELDWLRQLLNVARAKPR